eukprot:gene2486-5416_t
MFGLLIPGRLVNTELEPVTETAFTFTVPNIESVNHVAVFLTGELQIPDGFGASVYLCWPNPEPSWVLLGYITNQKPSALFRIVNVRPDMHNPSNPFQAASTSFVSAESVSQIGISIEPLAEIEQATAASKTRPSKESDMLQFINFAVESLFNFVTSFATDSETIQQYGTKETWFPLSALHRWRERLEARLVHNPFFWRQ